MRCNDMPKVCQDLQVVEKDVRQAAKHMRSFADEESQIVNMVCWQSINMLASARQHLVLQSLVRKHPQKPSQAPRSPDLCDWTSTHSSGRSRKGRMETF